MGLFGALIKTTVETVKLPVAIAKDVFSLGGVAVDRGSYTVEKLEDIKKAAEDK